MSGIGRVRSITGVVSAIDDESQRPCSREPSRRANSGTPGGAREAAEMPTRTPDIQSAAAYSGDSGSTLTGVVDEVAPTQVGSGVRAALVFGGAVVVGGVGVFALLELLGVGEVRWGNTQLRSLGSAIGALGLGALAGVLLLPRSGSPFMVRVTGPVAGWPGARLGGAALLLAPLMLLAGELLRSGHYYFFPAQLSAMVADRVTMLTSYALYTAGLVLIIPAFLALAGLISQEQPGWGFWGGTIAVVGSTVRIFQEGISFLALQLVGAQGLEAATAAVSTTYGDWYVLQTLNGSDNIAYGILAIGAYRARVLGWVPALCVAFMITHYSGVLKGTDLNSLTGAVLLAAALVPVGVSLGAAPSRCPAECGGAVSQRSPSWPRSTCTPYSVGFETSGESLWLDDSHSPAGDSDSWALDQLATFRATPEDLAKRPGLCGRPGRGTRSLHSSARR